MNYVSTNYVVSEIKPNKQTRTIERRISMTRTDGPDRTNQPIWKLRAMVFGIGPLKFSAFIEFFIEVYPPIIGSRFPFRKPRLPFDLLNRLWNKKLWRRRTKMREKNCDKTRAIITKPSNGYFAEYARWSDICLSRTVTARNSLRRLKRLIEHQKRRNSEISQDKQRNNLGRGTPDLAGNKKWSFDFSLDS